MVHITSLVMEKMQFNHYPIVSPGEIPNHEQITIVLAILPLPKNNIPI